MSEHETKVVEAKAAPTECSFLAPSTPRSITSFEEYERQVNALHEGLEVSRQLIRKKDEEIEALRQRVDELKSWESHAARLDAEYRQWCNELRLVFRIAPGVSILETAKALMDEVAHLLSELAARTPKEALTTPSRKLIARCDRCARAVDATLVGQDCSAFGCTHGIYRASLKVVP